MPEAIPTALPFEGPLLVQLKPANDLVAEAVKREFTGEEILESSAFTGAELLSLVVITREALNRILTYFVEHRQSFSDANIKIGVQEISLQGYTADEIQSLVDSGALEKLIREVKKV